VGALWERRKCYLFLRRSLIDPDDGIRMFLQNVTIFYHTTQSHPRTPYAMLFVVTAVRTSVLMRFEVLIVTEECPVLSDVTL
jgi:hypothetical protein